MTVHLNEKKITRDIEPVFKLNFQRLRTRDQCLISENADS